MTIFRSSFLLFLLEFLKIFEPVVTGEQVLELLIILPLNNVFNQKLKNILKTQQTDEKYHTI